MTIHQPPRLATWLLKRLGATTVEEALVGDLLEEYQARRSPMWYWWQVVVATSVGAWRDLRNHRPVAIGAIVVGLPVVSMPAFLLISTPASRLSNVPLPISIQILAAQVVMVGAAMLSGWVVSRVFRTHRAAAVLSLAAAILVAGLLLPDVVDLAPLALGSIIALYALLAVVGGSLAGTDHWTARG